MPHRPDRLRRQDVRQRAGYLCGKGQKKRSCLRRGRSAIAGSEPSGRPRPAAARRWGRRHGTGRQHAGAPSRGLRWVRETTWLTRTASGLLGVMGLATRSGTSTLRAQVHHADLPVVPVLFSRGAPLTLRMKASMPTVCASVPRAEDQLAAQAAAHPQVDLGRESSGPRRVTVTADRSTRCPVRVAAMCCCARNGVGGPCPWRAPPWPGPAHLAYQLQRCAFCEHPLFFIPERNRQGERDLDLAITCGCHRRGGGSSPAHDAPPGPACRGPRPGGISMAVDQQAAIGRMTLSSPAGRVHAERRRRSRSAVARLGRSAGAGPPPRKDLGARRSTGTPRAGGVLARCCAGHVAGVLQGQVGGRPNGCGSPRSSSRSAGWNWPAATARLKNASSRFTNTLPGQQLAGGMYFQAVRPAQLLDQVSGASSSTNEPAP